MKNFWANFFKLLNEKKFSIITVISLLIVDQTSKYFFDAMLYPDKRINIFENVFSIFATHNDGAGYSILSGKVWLLIIISVVFLTLMFLFNHFHKSKSKTYKIAFDLIIAGAFGNLIDRVFLGYVRDFVSFDLIHFPVFNFADTCITIGVILLCVYLIFIYKDKPKKEGEEECKD